MENKELLFEELNEEELGFGPDPEQDACCI